MRREEKSSTSEKGNFTFRPLVIKRNRDIRTVDPQSITDQEQGRETISGEPVVQSLSFASE